MGFTAEKIEVVTIKLEPKAGTLAKAYAALREAKVNVKASWGYQMGPGEAEAKVFAVDHAAAMKALAGFKATKDNAVWIEGSDDVGAYHDALDKLAKANINVEASDAFAIGGRFAAVFFFHADAYDAATKALGA